MTTEYGVNPQGFFAKPLADIKRDIEARNIANFGPGIIQTAQSPLGQLNGMAADLAAELYELGQDIYTSLDPDQAEGARLDIIAKLRIISRQTGEEDAAYRRAITNAERGRIDVEDIERAALGIDGVEWAKVWVNAELFTDTNGMPPGSLAAVVIGGDDLEVATAVRRFAVPGVTIFGNTRVEVEIDGRCRAIQILRPTVQTTAVEVTVERAAGRDGCPPPALAQVADGLLQALQSSPPDNGESLTLHDVRTASAQQFGRSVTVESATGLVDTVAFDQAVRVSSVAAVDA